MANPPPLIYDQIYHVYNRGNNGEILFCEDRNYPYFLNLYADYIEPVAETYAYCLMSNHFHVLIRIKAWPSFSGTPLLTPSDNHAREASRAFASLFGTYTKAFNKAYQRSGSLFEKPFNRVCVDKDRYFAALVAYIHRNPQKHGFARDFRSWPHSSYRAILSDQPTRIQREAVLEWFGGRAEFEAFHERMSDGPVIEALKRQDYGSGIPS